MTELQIKKAYEAACDTYSEYGITVTNTLEAFDKIPISIPCWQGDDVGGFEIRGGGASGGIMATGNYPGKPRTAEELRMDMERAISYIPGDLKINLHSSYGEDYEKDVDRDEYAPRHFAKWVAWAKENNLGLDFNCTTFGHPFAEDNLTISNPNDEIRAFWVRHMIAARAIAEHFGKELGTPCVYNTWVQDGIKDLPADRMKYRRLMKDSFDKILERNISKQYVYDALEPKLFGIGSESFTVGSHDFYLLYHGYAQENKIGNTIMNLDMGHFHPTESIADKISAVMLYSDKFMAHFTRGIRWDSDHVVINNDETNDTMREIVRADLLSDTFFGTDYFDATINRVAAWTIGTRAVKKALLGAMLEPAALLKDAENNGDLTKRLVLTDEFRSLPVQAVWDYYCLAKNAPIQTGWLDDLKQYEKDVMFKRQ